MAEGSGVPVFNVPSEVTRIYSSASFAAGTYYSTMIDCSRQKLITFKVTNTCNQVIAMQVIGNIENSTASAELMGSPMSVLALTGIISVGVNLEGDDWQPYIGMRIVVPAGVTLGSILIDEIHRG